MIPRLLIVVVTLSLVACQSTPPSLVSRYMSDAEVQDRLHQMDIDGVVLLDFSTDVAEFGRDTCRSQPIRLPRGETLAEYIRSAFETEFYRALMPTVQKLVRAAVTQPQFRTLLENKY